MVSPRIRIASHATTFLQLSAEMSTDLFVKQVNQTIFHILIQNINYILFLMTHNPINIVQVAIYSRL